MRVKKEKTKKIINTLKSCRTRLALASVGLLFIVIHNIVKNFPAANDALYDKCIKKLHGALAEICDRVDFSVAEVLIGIAVVSFGIYLVYLCVNAVLRKKFAENLTKLLLTAVMLFTLIYGGFCILWGTYYSASNLGVEKQCGITREENRHEDLVNVDKYFIEKANSLSENVKRDENGCYIMNSNEIFNHALILYNEIEQKYPELYTMPHKVKPVHFSVVMSYMDFTGFFFPFTGEANINVDSPGCMTPVTIAHELAHQHGIAAEDEANFVAILACMEDGDPDYAYSASLMAVVYLQNALYKTGDKETWQQMRDMYSDAVLKDFTQNNEYWKKFRKSASYKATNKTYDAFLKSYDQSDGVETYGKCVDYLVSYYKFE